MKHGFSAGKVGRGWPSALHVGEVFGGALRCPSQPLFAGKEHGPQTVHRAPASSELSSERPLSEALRSTESGVTLTGARKKYAHKLQTGYLAFPDFHSHSNSKSAAGCGGTRKPRQHYEDSTYPRSFPNFSTSGDLPSIQDITRKNSNPPDQIYAHLPTRSPTHPPTIYS